MLSDESAEEGLESWRLDGTHALCPQHYAGLDQRPKVTSAMYKARLDHSCAHSVKRLGKAVDHIVNLDGLLAGVTSRLEAAETNVMSERSQEVSRHVNEDAELMMEKKT